MNIGVLFGRRTWIGFGAALILMVLWLMLGALLAVRGIVSDGIVVWIAAGYLVSSFLGGCVAGKGQGRRLCAMVPALLLYVVVWLLALCSERVVDFASCGVWYTAAVALGAAAAWIRCGGKKKRRGKVTKRRPVRTVRR